MTVSNNYVHNIRYIAINGHGNAITIRNNEVANTVLINENHAFGGEGGWPPAVKMSRRPDNSMSTNLIIEGNHIHDAWGEGIMVHGIDGGRIVQNEIHDTYSTNIYIDAAQQLVLDSNHLYATTDIYNRPGRDYPANGITLANEGYDGTGDISVNHITISNNLFVGTGRGISYWYDSSNHSINNTYEYIGIYHNVIKDSGDYPIRIDEVPPNHRPPNHSWFHNNIIYKSTNGRDIRMDQPAAWTFSHNNWPDGIPGVAVGPGTLAVNPKFANSGGGEPVGFRLQTNSPMLNAGLSLANVNTDYWGASRDSSPSLGLHEPGAPPPNPGALIRINFQPQDASIPGGYMVDSGHAFNDRGNGFSYGWNENNFTARDRDRANSPDQRYDTLIHMQADNTDAVWEIALPNGSYEVKAVAGDARYTDSVYHLLAEGTTLLEGTPNTNNRWVQGTVTITVSDGRLTIHSGANSNNNKINFIEIQPITSVAFARINFQPSEAGMPNGYLVDSGSSFGNRGNGYSYGWNATTPITRDRNHSASPDQRYDTFNHMQDSNNPNAIWEIALPNGIYAVTAVAGDPAYYDSVYHLLVEGHTIIDDVPSASDPWSSGTILVTITDGRLTLRNGSRGVNNKVSFLEIIPATTP
jgi:hypothetical protein